VAVRRQLSITLENRPGALATLCSELAKVAVNIEAIQAGETRPAGPVRLLVAQPEAAKKVCERLGLPCVEEPVVAVGVGHRPGALGRVTRKLADAGIDIRYLYGTIEKGTKRALIICAVSDVDAAARLLR
jgi:hypothetical protein